MKYKYLFLSLFFIIFIYMTDQIFHLSDSNTFNLFLVFLPIVILLIIPSISSKEKKEKLAQERSLIIEDENKQNQEEFHNDFSRVGSADDPTPPRPMGMAADPIVQAREELDRDLLELKNKKDI